jgi:hypothetical protein
MRQSLLDFKNKYSEAVRLRTKARAYKSNKKFIPILVEMDYDFSLFLSVVIDGVRAGGGRPAR